MTPIIVPFTTNQDNFSCGVKVTKQILGFYKKQISDEELLNLLGIKSGDNNTDIISVVLTLIKIGLKPKLYINFPTKKTETKEIIKEFQDLIKKIETTKKQEYIEKLIQILKHSIENPAIQVIFKGFTEQDIKKELKKGNPIAVVVKSDIFSAGDSIKHPQHIILLTGMTDKEFIFTSSRRFNKDIALCMNAMYSAKIPTLLVAKE